MSMFAWNSNIDTSSSSQAGTGPAAPAQQRPLRWIPSALTRTSANVSTTSSSPTMTTLRQSTHIDDNSTLTSLAGPNNDPSLAESSHLAEMGVPAPQIPTTGDAGQANSVDRRRRGRPVSRPSMDGPPPVTAAQISAATAAAGAAMPMASSGVDNNNAEDLTSIITTPNTKKRGRLLTTSEETSLFQICNRHASTFGEHDRLCQWWATVTAEFTSETGHPYSWHSVRRKVELVTKQRIKFLAALRESGGVDRAEEGWKKALEAWIPAWERFQEQEAQRSAGKGWRRGRKRKTADALDEGEVASSQQQQQRQPHGFQQSPQVGDVGVQLPSGFDSMFDQQKIQPSRGGNATGKTKNAGKAAGDSTLSAALLETLSKLNRNLDARTSPITALPVTPSQHTPSLDTHNGNHMGHNSLFGRIPGPTIDELRQELKQELKEELRQELREEYLHEMQKDRAQMEERLDAVQRTHQMILELLQHEP